MIVGRSLPAPLILVLFVAACGGATDDPPLSGAGSQDAQSAQASATQGTADLRSVPPPPAPEPDGEHGEADTRSPPDAGTGEAVEPPDEQPAEGPPAPEPIPPDQLTIEVFVVPSGSSPHDVAPAIDGGVWYTAQAAGALGWLEPTTGETRHIDLGAGSRPHGVIVGPDGAPWITDGGLNAIARVDPEIDAVQTFPLPADRPNANLNTATFDGKGRLWFTGQSGVIGRLDPATGAMDVFDAPRGRGPYGITTTPEGQIYFASLAGSYVGRVDLESGEVTVLEPPTLRQGARRVWSDSLGRIWVREWDAGQLARFDPADQTWSKWRLPGRAPQAYAVFVDADDIVWVSDFGGNALHRFDPVTESFTTLALPSAPGNVRQSLGRPGEVWAPESAADQIILVRTATLPSARTRQP